VPDELLTVVRTAAGVPIDSIDELDAIAAAAPGAAVHVAVSPTGTSADGAVRLLRMAAECGLRPYGLTFRVDSVDPSAYSLAVERGALVMRRLEQFGIRVEMLEITAGTAVAEALDTDLVGHAIAACLPRLPYRPPLLLALQPAA
jgi:diaminopimelate decarboxylase